MEKYSCAFAMDKYIFPLTPSQDKKKKKEIIINLPFSNNLLLQFLCWIISFLSTKEKNQLNKSRQAYKHEQAFPTGECVLEFVRRTQTGGKLEIRFMRNWCWFLTFLNLQPIVFRGVSVSHRHRRESRVRRSREVGSPRLARFQNTC